MEKSSDVRVRLGAAAVFLVVAVLAGVAAGGAAATPRQGIGDAGGTALASGTTAPVTAPGVSSGASFGTAGANLGTAIRCPVEAGLEPGWACGRFPSYVISSNGTLAGVTATGQASENGRGQAVRDEAIKQAVADALDQAQAAAAATGVTLGKVIDMQISSPGYPYPLIERATPAFPGAEAGGGSTGAVTGGVAPSGEVSSGSATTVTVSPCPPKATCVQPAPVPVPTPLPIQTFVSVTVTWSIA